MRVKLKQVSLFVSSLLALTVIAVGIYALSTDRTVPADRTVSSDGTGTAQRTVSEEKLDCPGTIQATVAARPEMTDPDAGSATPEEAAQARADVELEEPREGDLRHVGRIPGGENKERYLMYEGDRPVARFSVEKLDNGRFAATSSAVCVEELEGYREFQERKEREEGEGEPR